MLTIDEIRTAIQSRPHEPAAFRADPSHACVAMILAGDDNKLDACFIRRAEHEHDPWSGQVAFPGGRAEPSDKDAASVAERETFEEIGVRLEPYHRIGPLPIRPIQRRDRRIDMTLSPFVYYVGVDGHATASVRQSREVASVFWVPLNHLFDEAATTELEYPFNGQLTTFPGIRFEDHIIWGLTLRVLESFADVMSLSLPALD
ncbi:MAG: CoA pyrophosphatase [Proteobacteria bacterium]|nr:CoA pyrophosphatase [Pseudomonadota bacterium]